MARKPWLADELVLGWKVDRGMLPPYWTESSARPGKHSLDDVIRTAARTIAHHTVIVAQSGSGKSYFLGRVLEEILLKTKSRLLILDPNADFRKISVAKAAENWTDPQKYKFDRTTGKGFLAEEPTRTEFLSQWERVTKVLYSRRAEHADGVELLQLDWLKLPIEFLLDEADDAHRDQIRHCHSLINTLAELAVLAKSEAWLSDGEFLRLAQKFCEDSVNFSESETVDHLGKIFQIPTNNGIRREGSNSFVELPKAIPTLAGIFLKKDDEASDEALRVLVHRASVYRKFVLEEARLFYFGRAFEIQKSGLIDPRIRKSFDPDRQRVEVVDLPSIADGRHQKMVMSALIEAEWSLARAEWERALDNDKPKSDMRVPTFIVVDEAHNAIPSVAESIAEKKLQEQFRRIAAEGRKYGLFLILVSQRPDKLDRMVVSECENRAVMKLGSTFILKTTSEVLGLEDSASTKMTAKVLEFEVGRALLIGPWAGGDPTILISAARRTEEGGRDLRSEHWATREIHSRRQE